MQKICTTYSVLALLCLMLACSPETTDVHVETGSHPRLSWTPAEVQNIRKGLGEVPLYDQSLTQIIDWVELEMSRPMEVPVPKDMAGGYTHERHKENWYALYHAAMLYQITEEDRYAAFVRDMLMEYAALYPDLPRHPTNRSYATGKIFWQCLNDANWLVYVSQAYDNVYEWLSAEERELLEGQLFRPFADFLSLENPQFFNRVHNHGTWANVAVGMIALAMEDDELLDRALNGLDPELIPAGLRDDDTGLIRGEGDAAAGFYAQLDGAFSPDGYFSEGPYYLRYAIFPYLVFSQALANSKPDLDILSYRDSILHKATYGLLYQADHLGHFFPINDAQKGMSWQARELVTAVDMAYYYYEPDPRLLSVVERQGRVILDATGFAAARDLAMGKAETFAPTSRLFVDGVDGSEGGLAVLRAPQKEGDVCLAVKFTAQGMGHGHFDKLSYSYYDEDGEVIQDYGAARWVNIDQKGGGRYLPENQTWAKQSIAHNTLVINERSHYNGDIRIGEQFHSELIYFDASDPAMQVVSVLDTNAYPGYSLERTFALFVLPQVESPLLIDLFRVAGNQAAQFDLPLWYQGQLMESSFEYELAEDSPPLLGSDHGYQHLWQEAVGQAAGNQVQFSWLERGEFYTLNCLTQPDDELHLLRLGANDPDFNLRRDPAFMIRKSGQSDATFLSVLEQHGSYNPVDERPRSPYGQLSGLELLHESEDYTAFALLIAGEEAARLLFCHSKVEADANHRLTIAGEEHAWQGPFTYQIKETESNE